MLEEDSVSLKQASLTANPSICVLDSSTKYETDQNGDCDSYGSMETLSDTVSITIDGEKHWVSGVDATTTCADLICALLHYQQLEEQRQLHAKSPHSKSNQIVIQTKEVREDDGNVLGDSHGNGNAAESEIQGVQQLTDYAQSVRNSHEYVIVKQLKNCHFEEYLDGSTRLMDVIPLRDNFGKKLCELQLRNLCRTSSSSSGAAVRGASRVHNQAHNHNQMFSMLSMSTDKDSGMGSPVGSSRSERFRRRRGKQRSHLRATVVGEQQQQLQQLQANPRRRQAEGAAAAAEETEAELPNERLMNIILAQDETINRQMSLLNDKEQQILKIEHEKHRKRERELGKNYLLDAYLKTMDKPSEALEHRGHQLPLVTDSQLPDELQIFWLEKVYALNKQLQREEEQLLRLHAKVRKQQVRHAYHTKGEVLQQIDRLDNELAGQVADIYQVERQLLMANEQLKAKLGVLECLGREFELEQHGGGTPELPQQQQQQQQQSCLLRATIQKQIEPQPRSCNMRQSNEEKLLKKQLFGCVDNPKTVLSIEQLGTLV